MPPSAAVRAPTSPAGTEAGLQEPDVHAPGGMWFGRIPITETTSFPPTSAPYCWVYVTLNAEIALSLPGNPALEALLVQARSRVSVDGQWLWWALRRKYPHQPLAKLSGSELIYLLAAHCERHQRRLLLLGSTPALNTRALIRLRQQYPTLKVFGHSPEPYSLGHAEQTATAEAAAMAAITRYEPDFVVLGLGAEKEHRLALRLSRALDGRMTGILCFGGAIDMASGQVRRAAPWMQSAGIEALYRVWQQPRRLPRLLRVLRIVPRLALGNY